MVIDLGGTSACQSLSPPENLTLYLYLKVKYFWKENIKWSFVAVFGGVSQFWRDKISPFLGKWIEQSLMNFLTKKSGAP